MFRWKKLGKVFDPKDLKAISWMHEFAQSPSALIEDAYQRGLDTHHDSPKNCHQNSKNQYRHAATPVEFS